MKKYTKHVNVFQGCGKTDLPKPEGIASKWLFIKAQVGNTHPHAAYPFGKMTAAAYTGGYPTGYGNLRPSSCGESMTFDAHVHGFAHVHQSGTGAIGYYYNFALTTPRTDGLGRTCDELESEQAEPGYYSATLAASGIRCEMTVSESVALHRYTMPEDGILQIDMSNCGCTREFSPKFYTVPVSAEVRITSPSSGCTLILLCLGGTRSVPRVGSEFSIYHSTSYRACDSSPRHGARA